jgi:hypothetical protein
MEEVQVEMALKMKNGRKSKQWQRNERLEEMELIDMRLREQDSEQYGRAELALYDLFRAGRPSIVHISGSCPVCGWGTIVVRDQPLQHVICVLPGPVHERLRYHISPAYFFLHFRQRTSRAP